MRLDVAFLHAARAEFIDASAWYESRRSGLGREFIAEIDRCVARAAEQPLQFAASVARKKRSVFRDRSTECHCVPQLPDHFPGIRPAAYFRATVEVLLTIRDGSE